MRKKSKSSRHIYCSFCGKNSVEVNCIISGPGVYICDECISTAREIMLNDFSSKAQSYRREIPIPERIYKELSNYVIGQEKAKKVLSVAVYNHYKRISSHIAVKGDVEVEKSNILLIGPTGTGKTLLAQTLAKFLHVPFSISDATVLTEAGYVGEDVENILVRLLQAADYDLEQTEKGIIYIDEIDKIGRKEANVSITRDVSGEGVQQALLKIIEGTVSSVPPRGGRKHPEQSLINVNTKNILFICGGTFEGLDTIVRHRLGKTTIGFGANIPSRKDIPLGELLWQVEPEDLIKFGMIPELVGRIPVIAGLDELNGDALMKILTEPKNSIVKQYEKLFKMENVDLEFTPDALEEVVKISKKRGMGARGLRAVLESVMLDIMFEIPSQQGIKKCKITKDSIKKKTPPLLVYKSLQKKA